MNHETTTTQPRQSFWQNRTALITVAVSVVLTLAIFCWAAVKTLTTIEQFAKPVTNSTTHLSVFSIAESLHRHSKLVIQTALITVDQSLEKENVLSLGGFAFGLGNSNLRMVSMGNRVQYFIPMSEISKGDLSWNAEEKILTLKVPPPVVDTEMVELQSDPHQILFLGEESWFDWARGTGKDELAQSAQKNLRSYVLRTARTRYHMTLAEENAQRELERLLRTLLYPIEPEARIQIEFKDRH